MKIWVGQGEEGDGRPTLIDRRAELVVNECYGSFATLNYILIIGIFVHDYTF